MSLRQYYCVAKKIEEVKNMNIYEAAKQAAKMGTGFYRPGPHENTLIISTNTQACCLVMRTEWKKEEPSVRWQPQLDDLISEDWEVKC